MIIARNPRLFINLCRLVFSIGILRIRFYPEHNRVLIENKPISKYLSIASTCISSFMAIIYLLQCLLNKKDSSTESVVSWVFLMLLFVGLAYLHELRRKPNEIVCLLNSLFQLNSFIPGEIIQEKKSLEVTMNIAFVQCDLITAIFLPIGFVYGLHLGNPCKASLVGFWGIHNCAEVQTKNCANHIINLIIKCVIFLLNHWMWSLAMHAGTFGVCSFITLGVRAVHQFLLR